MIKLAARIILGFIVIVTLVFAVSCSTAQLMEDKQEATWGTFTTENYRACLDGLATKIKSDSDRQSFCKCYSTTITEQLKVIFTDVKYVSMISPDIGNQLFQYVNAKCINLLPELRNGI